MSGSPDPDIHQRPRANGTANHTPNRSESLPASIPLRIHKRIIVCCDGTWQDGINKKYPWQYSNILKLARSLRHEDSRHDPPIPQVVFYQSGIGSENNLYSEIVEGGIGKGLEEKVQEAYAFVAHNYAPGDEIFLFGFSRGAYTARMVAEFIGGIGILSKPNMDHFAKIFVAYQTLGKPKDEKEKEKCNRVLKPFTSADAPGKVTIQSKSPLFSIKCVGVFDTVGSVGLPKEIERKSASTQLFGFNDLYLGSHIERGLQALALNETREDFLPATFQQTEEGKRKGQTLHQCWFVGCHSDIGGGYEFHDLADITLTWMVANIEDILAVDPDYVKRQFTPVAPYGELVPHESNVGFFKWANIKDRSLPQPGNKITNETIHPSALCQKNIRVGLTGLVDQHPELLWKLLPLEEQVKMNWKVDADASNPTNETAIEIAKEERSEERRFMEDAKKQMEKLSKYPEEVPLDEPIGGNQAPGARVNVVREKSWGTAWISSLLDVLDALSG